MTALDCAGKILSLALGTDHARDDSGSCTEWSGWGHYPVARRAAQAALHGTAGSEAPAARPIAHVSPLGMISSFIAAGAQSHLLAQEIRGPEHVCDRARPTRMYRSSADASRL